MAVTFTFTPTPLAPQKEGGVVLRRPGEWQEVVATLVLKGGVCGPGASEEKTVTVILRGFMPGAEEELIE